MIKTWSSIFKGNNLAKLRLVDTLTSLQREIIADTVRPNKDNVRKEVAKLLKELKEIYDTRD